MKMRLILPLIFKLSVLTASSISELSKYPHFCLQAATNAEVFLNFKRSPLYQPILEHVGYNQGLEYLQIIEKKYAYILNHIDVCRENDIFGNPIIFDYGSIIGEISPTTLRYMKVSGDLIALFGNLKNKKIVEIGGGYGGQCKVLSGLCEFSSYTIIDLPEASLLSARYLSSLGIDWVSTESNTTFTSSNSYDLVVSNYAFSECSIDEQINYIEKILNKSSCGYMSCNFISNHFGINSLSLEKLLELIKIPGREIRVVPEDPLTSSDNLIVIWKPIS